MLPAHCHFRGFQKKELEHVYEESLQAITTASGPGPHVLALILWILPTA